MQHQQLTIDIKHKFTHQYLLVLLRYLYLHHLTLVDELLFLNDDASMFGVGLVSESSGQNTEI